MKSSNQAMHPLHDVSPEDAVGMLIADHKRVANLFADFKRMTEEGRDEQRRAVVGRICEELTLHTQLEEEIFYPAVRKATEDDDQMDEALVEHAGAKLLIAQLRDADPDDDLYDAKVTVLGQQIDHHVEEEEGSMFPKARFSGVDTLALGALMAARKSELMSGATVEAAEVPTPRSKAKKPPAKKKAAPAPKKKRR